MHLVNKLYDEINIGDSASLKRTLMPEDVKLFAVLTSDVNPGVVDPKFSESGMFRELIAHGMWNGSLISTVLGTQFPGPGTILIDQSLHYSRPVTIGHTVTIKVTVKQKYDRNRHVVFDCVCSNQEGLQVVRGTAEVLAPTEKVSRLEEVHMPEIRIDDNHERYTHLLSRVKGLEPIPTAVAHPCDKESLKGPVIAFQEGIIEPILVGPENKIRSVAEEFGIDLHGIRIVILLQVMDHGKLTDHNGRAVDFRNVILIMTSNAGAADMQRAAIGFGRDKREGEDTAEVGRTFTPEFCNRLDAVISFAPLGREIILQVVEKFVLQLEAQLIDRGVHIELTPEAAAWLGEKGYDDKMGARALGRVIQEHIKKPLAEELLFGRLTKGGVVRVTVKDDAIELQVQEPQKPRLTGQKPPLLTAE